LVVSYIDFVHEANVQIVVS